MGIAANTDFQRWLGPYAAAHERLHSDGPPPPAGICDGCGDPLPEPPSPTPFCIVCLAEQYGRDRAQAAGRIGCALRLAIAREDRIPVTDIRAAVEQALDELEVA